MAECIVTRHAAERAAQRFRVEPVRARRFVLEAFAGSVRLPWRYARTFLQTMADRKGQPTIRIYGDVLLVCRGSCVITVWPLDVDQVATVLAWAATRVWAHEVVA